MTDLHCPLCDGLSHGLGLLGSLLHCRCEACGWTFHVPAPAGEDCAMLEAAAIVEHLHEERDHG